MLATEKAVPKSLAYDRPSPKLLGFLRKHYGLTRYVPQNNNYVVYDDYFRAAVPHKPQHEGEEDKAFDDMRHGIKSLLLRSSETAVESKLEPEPQHAPTYGKSRRATPAYSYSTSPPFAVEEDVKQSHGYGYRK